jgi:2-polyprenyl-3-methyl-5-hydroxy-6-metoxy-1,4-benzoquinol methylase
MAVDYISLLLEVDQKMDAKLFRAQDRWQAMRNNYYDAIGYGTRFAMQNRQEQTSVLDAGCGTGAVSEAVLRYAEKAEVTAVDLMAGALARAKERLLLFKDRVKLVQRDLVTEEIGGPYDAVFCFEVLNYDWFHLDEIYKKFSEVLAPGGMLIVGLPLTTGSLLAELGESLKDDGFTLTGEINDYVTQQMAEIWGGIERHVKYFSRTDHLIALKKAGFTQSDLIYLKFNFAIICSIKE